MGRSGAEDECSQFRFVYVGGLPDRTSDSQFEELCRRYGNVQSAHVALDPVSGASWHFGVAEFQSAQDARGAVTRLRCSRFRGAILAATLVESAPPECTATMGPNTIPATDFGKTTLP